MALKTGGIIIRDAFYRPFSKAILYFDPEVIERPGLHTAFFPTPKHENLIISIASGKNELPLIVNGLPDFHFNGDTQCFPLYHYEEAVSKQAGLFDNGEEKYARRSAITDFIHSRCREQYGARVREEDIFYYVYGLLHSSDYRLQFSSDLKKMLPGLPLVDNPDDFWAFGKAGRDLAALHLTYEEQTPCADIVIAGEDSGNYRVEKMRFADKDDKSVIIYNGSIRLSNIPLAAYEYILNGRSAIEWIMERYQVRVDKASGIRNDPNDWGLEHGNPRYILDLLLRVTTVGLETMRIVHGLPKLTFFESN